MLKAPGDKEAIGVNPTTGKAYNITFTWERYHEKSIKQCEIEIATDPAFDALVHRTSIYGIDDNMIALVIGPSASNIVYSDTQVTYAQADFMPNKTYYWRVRVNGTDFGPTLSPWSTTRSFSVEGEMPFAITTPEIGATGVSLTPTLGWTEYPGALSYEVALAEDPTFAVLDISHSADTTFYKIEEVLPYATTFYWRVRGVTGEADPRAKVQIRPGGPWASGVFTTMAEPVEPTPPVVIEPTPPSEIQIVEVPVQAPPAAIPAYLLWTIIGIGAVLVIALIVLIVRTRRVV
jgi:hypothetical protein